MPTLEVAIFIVYGKREWAIIFAELFLFVGIIAEVHQ